MKRKTEKSSLVRLVDDDLDLLEGLTYMLEEEGWKVRTYPSAESFLELDDKNAPGCIVLDYIMPRITGVELQQILEKRGFKQPVLFLTAHADLDMAISVFRKGAENLLKKPVDPDEFLEAIQKALERDRRQRENKQSAGRYAALSEREREVIRLVSEGLMNNQIAERLGLSERTVESHRFHAYQKIGVSTAKELKKFLEKAN